MVKLCFIPVVVKKSPYSFKTYSPLLWDLIIFNSWPNCVCVNYFQYLRIEKILICIAANRPKKSLTYRVKYMIYLIIPREGGWNGFTNWECTNVKKFWVGLKVVLPYGVLCILLCTQLVEWLLSLSMYGVHKNLSSTKIFIQVRNNSPQRMRRKAIVPLGFQKVNWFFIRNNLCW